MGTTDQAASLQRQAYVQKLRERYSKFGDRIVDYLCEKSLTRGGLRVLLSKVIRPLPYEDDRMHDALVRFLSAHGIEAFFDRVEQKNGTDTPLEGRPRDDLREQQSPDSVEGYRPTILGTTAVPGAEALLPASVQPQAVARPQPSLEGQGAPEAEVAPEEPPPEFGIGPWNGVERRSGVDRRTGRERRSGKDRRQRVDTVFVNRRFGGDRRSSIQRRSAKERRENPPLHNARLA